MEKRSIFRTLREGRPVTWCHTRGSLWSGRSPCPPLPAPPRSLVEELVPCALALVQVASDVLYQAQQGLARLQQALAGAEES